METVDRRLTGKLVADETMPPGCREQYRRLAAVLHHSQAVNGMKVVMIASAVAGEGKTLTATNLALTFSESYQRRVLLIDGDLRRPSVHVVFGIQSVPGLSEGLTAVEPRKLPLHQVSERLTILPAGKPTSDPMSALISDRVKKIIDEARQAFDWVIIDTPPVGLMTDANLVATMTDGAILVVKADSTPVWHGAARHRRHRPGPDSRRGPQPGDPEHRQRAPLLLRLLLRPEREALPSRRNETDAHISVFARSSS